MKKILLLSMALFFFGMETANALSRDSVKTDVSTQKVKKQKFIHTYVAPRDVVFLEIYKPGRLHLLKKTSVFGKINIEADGFRFTPEITSPDGYVPQELFDKLYWYNPLFKELFITYDDILSIKKNGTVKTKAGKKYNFYSRIFKDISKEVESKMNRSVK